MLGWILFAMIAFCFDVAEPDMPWLPSLEAATGMRNVAAQDKELSEPFPESSTHIESCRVLAIWKAIMEAAYARRVLHQQQRWIGRTDINEWKLEFYSESLESALTFLRRELGDKLDTAQFPWPVTLR